MHTKNKNQNPTIAYKAFHHQVPDSLSHFIYHSLPSVSHVPTMLCPMLFPNYHTLLPQSLCNLPFPLSKTFFCHISTYHILPLHSSQTSLHQRDLSHISYYQQQPSTLSLSSLLSCFYITCVCTAYAILLLLFI